MFRHAIAFLIIAAMAFAGTLLGGSGCYRCDGPDCSNLPPINPVPPDWPASPDDAVEVVPESSVEAASSPCGRSCANFKRLGCPEAEPSSTGVSCYRVCVHGSALRRIPSACWASAASVDALRACGRIRCIH